MLVEQDSAADVTEGERVTWEERPGSIRFVLDHLPVSVYGFVFRLLAKYFRKHWMDRDELLQLVNL